MFFFASVIQPVSVYISLTSSDTDVVSTGDGFCLYLFCSTSAANLVIMRMECRCVSLMAEADITYCISC